MTVMFKILYWVQEIGTNSNSSISRTSTLLATRTSEIRATTWEIKEKRSLLILSQVNQGAKLARPRPETPTFFRESFILSQQTERS